MGCLTHQAEITPTEPDQVMLERDLLIIDILSFNEVEEKFIKNW